MSDSTIDKIDEPGEPFLLPLFPLNLVLYPEMMLPLHIFEERYRVMIGECFEQKKPFGVILIKEGKEVGGSAVPVRVGTTARIIDLQEIGDGRMHILTRGVRRFAVENIVQGSPYLIAEARHVQDEADPKDTDITERVRAEYNAFLGRITTVSGRAQRDSPVPSEAGALSFAIATKLSASVRIPAPVRQDWLEAPSAHQRLTQLSSILVNVNKALEEEILKGRPDDLLLN